jgi:hypothetical protein
MKFDVSTSYRAYQEANDLVSQHKSEATKIVAAWDAIKDELREDAHAKGEQVRGHPSYRRIYRKPLWLYYLVKGTKAQIRKVRYLGP